MACAWGHCKEWAQLEQRGCKTTEFEAGKEQASQSRTREKQRRTRRDKTERDERDEQRARKGTVSFWCADIPIAVRLNGSRRPGAPRQAGPSGESAGPQARVLAECHEWCRRARQQHLVASDVMPAHGGEAAASPFPKQGGYA